MAEPPLTVDLLLKKLQNKRCNSTQPCFCYNCPGVIDKSVVEFAKQNKEYFLDIQDWCKNTIVVFIKKFNVKNILFDGSQIVINKKNGQPRLEQKTIIFVLDKNGVLKKMSKTTPDLCYKFFKNVKQNKFVFFKDLGNLIFNKNINIEEEIKSRKQILALLKDEGLDDFVLIRWCYYFYPKTGKSKTVDWIKPQECRTNKEYIILEAFTGKNGSLCFRKEYKKEKMNKSELKITEAKSIDYTFQLNKVQKPVDCDINNPHTNNRSCSYSVTLVGLSQAYRLGAIVSKEELTNLSEKLAKCIPGVWFHLDCKGNICHAAFINRVNSNSVKCFELETDGNYQNSSWEAFFLYMWAQFEEVRAYKQVILKPTMCNLSEENTTKNRSTRHKCYLSLKQCTEHVTVHTFSDNDKLLHAFKLAFAHYVMCKSKKSTNIKLRTTRGSNLIALVSTNVSFENTAHLLEQSKIKLHPYEDEGVSLFRIASDWQDGEPFTLPPLIEKPVIHYGSSLGKTRVYIPCKIMASKSLLSNHLEKRSQQLLDILNWTYAAFAKYICKKYCLDVTTLNFQTLASLSCKCILLSFYKIGGNLAQSIEKTKINYAKQIRKHTRGGFSYSFGGSIEYGQTLNSNHKVVGIQEYDVTSCYGFSACTMRAPSGFCVGYTRNEENGLLERTDSLLRAKTFEYRAGMFLLHILDNMYGPALSVYSNFSPLGLFYIGKYPVDLVVILDNPSRDVLVVQFDGQFAHGCRTCPPLSRYVNDLQESELLERTDVRNDFINRWIESANSLAEKNAAEFGQIRQTFTYKIITDCHDCEFTQNALSKKFTIIRELKDLYTPYACLPLNNIPLDLNFILNAHPDLTYILIGSGFVPLEFRQNFGMRNGRLLVWKKLDVGGWIQDFGWETGNEGALFTRDTLENAVNNYGFQFERIDVCYFYRRCRIFPRVYQLLIDERINYSSKTAKSGFIKSIVNYSAGVMGYNPGKQVTHGYAKVTKNLPITNTVNSIIEYLGSVGNNHYILKITYKLTKNCNNRIINNALPVFASIVEFGRLRLQQIADFWEKHCLHGSIKICYSQVDNFIVALSAADIEDTIDPNCADSYYAAKKDYYVDENNPTKAPGKLKQVWTQNLPGWKFVSPYPCTCALTSQEASSDKWKMSQSVPSALAAYNIQRDLLSGLPQEIYETRRINIRKNANVQTVKLTIKPKINKFLDK